MAGCVNSACPSVDKDPPIQNFLGDWDGTFTVTPSGGQPLTRFMTVTFIAIQDGGVRVTALIQGEPLTQASVVRVADPAVVIELPLRLPSIQAAGVFSALRNCNRLQGTIEGDAGITGTWLLIKRAPLSITPQ